MRSKRIISFFFLFFGFLFCAGRSAANEYFLPRPHMEPLSLLKPVLSVTNPGVLDIKVKLLLASGRKGKGPKIDHSFWLHQGESRSFQYNDFGLEWEDISLYSEGKIDAFLLFDSNVGQKTIPFIPRQSEQIQIPFSLADPDSYGLKTFFDNKSSLFEITKVFLLDKEACALDQMEVSSRGWLINPISSLGSLFDANSRAIGKTIIAFREDQLASRRAKSKSSNEAVFNHLLLVYPNTAVTYIKDGVTKTYEGSMSDNLKTAVINSFRNLPVLISEGSANIVRGNYSIVIIPEPITTLTNLSGNTYWLSDSDIEADLEKYAPEGMYDSVHVLWNNGPIDAYWGLGGIFVNDLTTTFSSLIAGQAWWWTSIGEKMGEPFLHEWLHGVCRYYSSHGFDMPERDADGADIHGYKKSNTEGYMGYYRDLMQGKVWEPLLSKYTGISREAWLSGTPNLESISLLQPSGGEIWPLGTKQIIKWESKGEFPTVQIELSPNNGTTYILIANSAANSGEYNWDIPMNPEFASKNCLIRITCEAKPSIKDVSDATFEIRRYKKGKG